MDISLPKMEHANEQQQPSQLQYLLLARYLIAMKQKGYLIGDILTMQG